MTRYPIAPPVSIGDYYELRQYRVAPGYLAGDMRQAFARAGIPAPLGQWRGFAGPIMPQYACLLHWDNLDDRMAAWDRFHTDPSNRDHWAGVERWDISILRPSPVWEKFRQSGEPTPMPGVHDLRFYDVLNQDAGKAHAALGATDLPFLVARGATVLGVFMTWFGTRMNQAVTLLVWPDHDTMLNAYRAHLADPAINATRKAERVENGRPLLRGTDVHILQPLPNGLAMSNLSAIPAEPPR